MIFLRFFIYRDFTTSLPLMMPARYALLELLMMLPAPCYAARSCYAEAWLCARRRYMLICAFATALCNAVAMRAMRCGEVQCVWSA